MVFYAGLVYDEHDIPTDVKMHTFPNDAYIYCRDATGRQGDPRWLLADHTPVLLEDVPKDLRLLVLLMS